MTNKTKAAIEIDELLKNNSKTLHDRICEIIFKELERQKANGKRFISDEDIDKLIEDAIFEATCPSRQDYDNRTLGEYIFTQDYTVNNSVLYVKGDLYDPYNWNYSR